MTGIDEKTIIKFLESFKKQAQTARANYDVIDSSRNRRTWEKYRDLAEICRIALSSVIDEARDFSTFRATEHKMIQGVVEAVRANEILGKKTYTADEVKELLWKTMY